jgi:hypothetical protein
LEYIVININKITMKRMGCSFRDLYEAAMEYEILMEGLQYSHQSDVVLKSLTREFGGLIYGNISLASAHINKQTKPKEYIDIYHLKDLNENDEFMSRMKFFGYHFVSTKMVTQKELASVGIRTNQPFLYMSSFEGSYPTSIKRQNLPDVLFHITNKKNVPQIKKMGLLPKQSATSFNHPANRIYLFSTTNPNNDIPRLIKSLSDNTETPKEDYRVLRIVDYFPNHEKFFLDPSMDVDDISQTCRGIFVLRGIHPMYIK